MFMSKKAPHQLDQDLELKKSHNEGQIGQAGEGLIQVGRDYIQYISNNARNGHWGKVAFALLPLILVLYGTKEVGTKVVETFNTHPPDQSEVIASTLSESEPAIDRPSPPRPGNAETAAPPKPDNTPAAAQAEADRQAAAQAEADRQAAAQAEADRQAAAQAEARERAEAEARRRDSVCILTITNSLVSLNSEPQNFSQELASVSPGEYIPVDYTVTNFGGLSNDGWFLIEAEGRRGWIKDNTWTIDSKTRACQ